MSDHMTPEALATISAQRLRERAAFHREFHHAITAQLLDQAADALQEAEREIAYLKVEIQKVADDLTAENEEAHERINMQEADLRLARMRGTRRTVRSGRT